METIISISISPDMWEAQFEELSNLPKVVK